MNCKECGNRIGEGAAFCDKCGSAVGENAQQAIPQQQNAPQLPKKKKGKGCLVSVLAVVGFFIIVGIITSIFRNDSEERESATPDTQQTTTGDISDDGGIVADDTNNDNAIDAPQKNVNDTGNVPLVNIPDGGIVIFDEDGFVVTVMQVNRGRDGYVSDIDFTITNNGEDEKSIETVNRNFVSSAIKINNFSLRDSLSSTVSAGKAARENVNFSSQDMGLLGIKDVYDITMQFEIYESVDFVRKNVVEYEPATIVISENNHPDFINGNLVFSNQQADVYACGFYSGWLLTEAVFVVKNKTDNDAWFGIESVSVNGIMNDDEGRGDIYKDTYRIFRVTLEDDFNETNVNEIEFTLRMGEFQSIVPSRKEEIAIVTVAY